MERIRLTREEVERYVNYIRPLKPEPLEVEAAKLQKAYKVESQETETWNGIHAQITAPKGTFERIFNDKDDDNDI